MLRRRSAECGPLLDFEEVRRRLQLGTRQAAGTHEIVISQIIGSVSRAHEFDGCFRPLTERLRDVLDQIRRARPDAANTAIHVYQVDHAYFVVDGHKRLALAAEEGREVIDAVVDRFASRFHLASGTTIEEVRATQRELRFRQLTGLDVAVPEARFPLGSPEGYLDLEESLKAHAYDLSRSEGRLVPPVEAARHWYERVYRAAVGIALESGVDRLLTSSTEAELFLMVRHGSQEQMAPGWEVAPAFRERTVDRLRATAPGRIPAALARVVRWRRPQTQILSPSDTGPGIDHAHEPTDGSRGPRDHDAHGGG
jgi:hypothetical protein